MKITYAKLFDVFTAADTYPKLIDGKENKLTYALRRFIKANAKLIEAYNEAALDLKIDFASVDSNKNLIMNSNNLYSYTKESQKALNAKLKELNNKEIEVDAFPIKAADVPTDLLASFRDLFEGIVIESEPTTTEPVESSAEQPTAT